MPREMIEKPKQWCDAPTIISGSVRLAFAPGGEFHGKLKLEWHGFDHLWSVMERVEEYPFEKDPQTGLFVQGLREKWVLVTDTEHYGGAQPDERLLTALRRMDCNRIGQAAAHRMLVNNLLAADKREEAADEERHIKKEDELNEALIREIQNAERNRVYFHER